MKTFRIGLHEQQQIRFVDQSDHAAAVEYRQLRDIELTHALVDREQRVGGTDTEYAALLEATRDQVAQVAVFAPRKQAMFDHPVVVVDLRQIACARIADESDDALGGALLTAVTQCGREKRTGRRAAEDT